MEKDKIIAVDFDGTLCENLWPEIGAPRKPVIDYVLAEQKKGARLILWTNRSGDYLAEAVEWCRVHGIEFDAVNENLPEMVDLFHNDCRKVFANEYIDDRAIPMPGSDLLGEMAREINYIRERIGEGEVLAQLAEECAELTQAALKYRRVLTGNNPTPKKAEQAVSDLIEEMADTELCVAMLCSHADEQQKKMIERANILRWATRLKDAENG